MNEQKFLDESGVVHLYNKLSLQDYPNNETLIGVINAIDETKADKTDIIQADWNENDETAIDYIKNKPNENNAIRLAIETELISPVATASGEILTDNNSTVITM